jgi:hypothetical protein
VIQLAGGAPDGATKAFKLMEVFLAQKVKRMKRGASIAKSGLTYHADRSIVCCHLLQVAGYRSVGPDTWESYMVELKD